MERNLTKKCITSSHTCQPRKECASTSESEVTHMQSRDQVCFRMQSLLLLSKFILSLGEMSLTNEEERTAVNLLIHSRAA